eukprot:346429_1
MPKVVSLKLRELRKRGYNNVSEWLANPKHLYIGRQMNISIYTHFKTIEPPGTKVSTNKNGTKILIRPYPIKNVPFDKHLLSYPIGSYVDNNGKIVHLCFIPQSKWHNPFKVKQQNTKEKRINQFKTYLLSNNILMTSLNELENYTEIGCWCKPLSCHGDTILNEFHRHKIRQKHSKNISNNKQNIQQKIQKQETKNNDYVDVWNMLPNANINTRNNKNISYNNQRKTPVWVEQKHNNNNKIPKISNVILLTMEMRTDISVQSALVIMPPKNKWNEIQNIRKLYDPAYSRWPPHINILFPFINEKYFHQIAAFLSNGIIKKYNIKVFNVYLNGFDTFDKVKSQTKNNRNIMNNCNNNVWNKNKMETLFLKPHGCFQNLQKIFNLLKKEWKQCAMKNNGKFIPHLTVGKFKIKEIHKYKNTFQSSWKPISFKCDAIYLIARRGQQAFKIKHKIPLCMN